MRNEPRRRALKITLGVFALLAIAVAALIGYALSERGLPYIVARIVAQTGGRITVDDPTGSVAGTMRFRRITWRGVDATVIADDVVVDWNPGALWSKRLSIRGLGARRVDIALKPSTGATAAADRSRGCPSPSTSVDSPSPSSRGRPARGPVAFRDSNSDTQATSAFIGSGSCASYRISAG